MLTFLSYFAYRVFRTNHKVFVEQEEVVDMQQNARIAIDQIVRDLRIAGTGVPTRRIESDVGPLYPLTPGDGGGNAPDTVRIIANFERIETALSQSMPNESANLIVASAAGFQVGSLAIVFGRTLEGESAGEAFQITHISTSGQPMLNHGHSPPWNSNQMLTHTYIVPSRVSYVICKKYYIDTADSSHPRLTLRENEGAAAVIADNIENLQFAYDLLTGETDLASPPNPALVRKITVTLVARTDTPDPQWNNGIHSVTGESDHYRRLVFQSDVTVRNHE